MDTLHFDCNRFDRGTRSTDSKLYVNGKRYRRPDGKYVYVLEDEDRGLDAAFPKDACKKKVDHETAIPYSVAGKPYEIGMTYSQKFKQVFNQIMYVPCFDGIRFHSGTVIANTWGCPMGGVGLKTDAPDKDINGYYRVWDSRTTMAPLLKMIADAFKKGIPVTWSVNKDY